MYKCSAREGRAFFCVYYLDLLRRLNMSKKKEGNRLPFFTILLELLLNSCDR